MFRVSLLIGHLDLTDHTTGRGTECYIIQLKYGKLFLEINAGDLKPYLSTGYISGLASTPLRVVHHFLP